MDNEETVPYNGDVVAAAITKPPLLVDLCAHEDPKVPGDLAGDLPEGLVSADTAPLVEEVPVIQEHGQPAEVDVAVPLMQEAGQLPEVHVAVPSAAAHVAAPEEDVVAAPEEDVVAMRPPDMCSNTEEPGATEVAGACDGPAFPRPTKARVRNPVYARLKSYLHEAGVGSFGHVCICVVSIFT